MVASLILALCSVLQVTGAAPVHDPLAGGVKNPPPKAPLEYVLSSAGLNTPQFEGGGTEIEFAEQIEDSMRVLHAESSERGGRILSVVIHPWVSGQPHRIKALELALSSILGYDGVWSASGVQILDAFESLSTT